MADGARAARLVLDVSITSLGGKHGHDLRATLEVEAAKCRACGVQNHGHASVAGGWNRAALFHAAFCLPIHPPVTRFSHQYYSLILTIASAMAMADHAVLASAVQLRV
eukprot:2422852-Amphidinium_carterae.1